MGIQMSLKFPDFSFDSYSIVYLYSNGVIRQLHFLSFLSRSGSAPAVYSA